MDEKGAYIYRDERDELVLMLYIPNPSDDGKTHTIAMFVDGRDYIGTADQSDIQSLIDQHDMTSIQDEAVYSMGDGVGLLIEFAQNQLSHAPNIATEYEP